MSYRSKLSSHKTKNKKKEQELHVLTNPFMNFRLQILDANDYQSPLTAHTLSPHSKWIIVRNNIHKIRSWGGINAIDINDQFRDWYLFIQMRRELRRFQEFIKQVDQRPNFRPVHYFYLPTDETHTRRYNVSHVRPSDTLYYSSFSHEPIHLQSLLYYFSKECVVPYTSIFRIFLSDICSILYQQRQRINRAVVLRKVASFIAIIVFIILGLMLFTLVISVLNTMSVFKKLYEDDPTGGIGWLQPEPTINSL